MALPNQVQPKTLDEGMEAIRQMASTVGDDFRVKVLKRTGASPSAPTEMIASYAAARVEHFAMPEAWLSQLAGGGGYVLIVLHETEPNTPVAVLNLTPITGPARPLDAGAIGRPNWTGPGTQLFPAVPLQQIPGGAPSVRSLFGQPEAAGAVEDAGARASVPAASAASGASLDRIMEARFAMLDAQRRSDSEAIAKAIEMQSKATERQISAMMEVVKATAQRPVVQEKSIVEQIVPLMTVMSPLIAAFVDGNAKRSTEEKKIAAEEASRREAREADARKTEREMLMQMNERAAAASGDMMKVISPMVEAVSQMGRTVLQQVATMQEMSAPPAPEEGITGLVRAGLQAFAESSAVKRMEMESAIANGSQRALPPMQQQHAQPQDPQQQPGEEMTPADIATMPAGDLVNEFVAALRAKHTVTEIADGYMMALANPNFVALVEQSGGPQKLFGPHLTDVLGQPGMADYVRGVVAELQKRGAKV